MKQDPANQQPTNAFYGPAVQHIEEMNSSGLAGCFHIAFKRGQKLAPGDESKLHRAVVERFTQFGCNWQASKLALSPTDSGTPMITFDFAVATAGHRNFESIACAISSEIYGEKVAALERTIKKSENPNPS